MSAYAQWTSLALLAISSVATAAGCSMESTSGPSGTDDSTCRTTACGRSGVVTLEALSGDDLPHNGLTRDAITRETLSASGTLLGQIQSVGLTDTSWLTSSNRDLIGSNQKVRALMEYIVSCALDRRVIVDTGIYVDGEDVIWSGELGLCGSSPEAFGDWAYSAPSEACKEIVSSCVLARVNALDKKIVISMRGTPSGLFPLHLKVPVEETYRENNGTVLIPSVKGCLGGEPWGDPTRDCGWKGRYVGTCMVNTEVTLGVSPGTMVRVCNGLHACLNESTADTHWYAGTIPSFRTTDSVTFTCPGNPFNPLGPSSFAIMVASPVPSVTVTDGMNVVMIGGGQYPSPETEIFRFQEGAFYGNIFNPASPVNDPQKVFFDDQYACYSDTWTSALAHLTDRLCAGRMESPCFENDPHPCLYLPFRSGIVPWDRSCISQSTDWEKSYFSCSHPPAPTPRWNHAITVFANTPCDLAKDLDSCKKAYAYPIAWQ